MPELFFPCLADVTLLGQTVGWPDLVVIGLLILLEGLLSIDNALVLGLLATATCVIYTQFNKLGSS